MRSSPARRWTLLSCAHVVLITAILAGAASEASEEPDLFDILSKLQGPELSSRSEEGIAQMMSLVVALQAAAASAGRPNEVLKLVAEEAAASTRVLADNLAAALGPSVAGFQPDADLPGQGRVHINLGRLLDLNPQELDARLAQAASLIGGPGTVSGAGAPPPSSPSSDAREHGPRQSENEVDEEEEGSEANSTAVAAREPATDPGLQEDAASTGRGLLQLQGVKLSSSERLVRNVSVAVNPTGKQGPVAAALAAARDRQAGKATLLERGRLGAALSKALAVDWEAVQRRIQGLLKQGLSKGITWLPRIKGPDRLKQIFQVLVNEVTGGEGLGQGCTPYVFNGGGSPLPEVIIFPSFAISQTTGNCVLIPEAIGNVEYPGQWALMNARIACLGPASEYLQVPAFYRGAATSAESFTCPTCRNEFSLGPAITLTLVGDSSQVIRYRNKAEFLAALRTNKTFGFGKDGLHTALSLFKARLEARQEVLIKHLRGTEGGASSAAGEDILHILSGLGAWLSGKHWDKYVQTMEHDLAEKSLRNLLRQS